MTNNNSTLQQFYEFCVAEAFTIRLFRSEWCIPKHIYNPLLYHDHGRRLHSNAIRLVNPDQFIECFCLNRQMITSKFDISIFDIINVIQFNIHCRLCGYSYSLVQIQLELNRLLGNCYAWWLKFLNRLLHSSFHSIQLIDFSRQTHVKLEILAECNRQRVVLWKIRYSSSHV